jgi:hypothetical protein
MACAGAVALAAACGGSSESDAGEAATTAAPPPGTAAPAGNLAERLPPEDAVGGLRPGTVRRLPTAQTLVDSLYQVGDPARDAAERRLEEGGYARGLLRDQAGEDPASGPALVRSYVIRMRDDEAAREEVADAVDEVESSSVGETSDVEVPGVDDSRGVRVEVSQGGVTGSVVFVTFADGPYVYGIQAVSREGADLPEEEVVRAAQDLDARVGA